MAPKILLAYGTMAGSTAEVAQAIAEELTQLGAQVDVAPVESINDLAGYNAVVLGSAVRMFHLLGKTRRFLRKHRKALQAVPVAYFLICLTMSEEKPETIEKATRFAKPMLNTQAPVSLGLFGGCINHEKLTDMFGKPLRFLPEQDHRDWDKIRAWAQEIYPLLLNR
jgi:menaquinone-dependent protoporphyrinogen oxidase